jgi:hypothetical protein
MGFESTLGWKLLYREELREDPVIDAHRYTAVVAIHVHTIVTHHGRSFKAPLAYQTCTRAASAAQRLRSNGQTGSYPQRLHDRGVGLKLVQSREIFQHPVPQSR